MKDVIVKVLLIAVALSAITYFVGSQSGLWGDSKTIRDRSHTTISDRLAPPP